MLWLQLAFDSPRLIILGVSDERYMIAKRHASRRANNKPFAVIDVMKNSFTSKLTSFFQENDVVCEDIEAVSGALKSEVLRGVNQ